MSRRFRHARARVCRREAQGGPQWCGSRALLLHFGVVAVQGRALHSEDVSNLLHCVLSLVVETLRHHGLLCSEFRAPATDPPSGPYRCQTVTCVGHDQLAPKTLRAPTAGPPVHH